MAEKHIANAENSWSAICITPDLCRVGKSVIPFDSYRDLSHDMVASPNVNARGYPVYRIGDIVQGTESNAGKGVFSGTSLMLGHVHIVADNTTVHVNGQICARHDSLVLMNNRNTVGRLQTSQGAPQGVVENGKLPCNTPPKSSPRLEQLEALKKDTAGLDPDQLDEFVRFDQTHAILDEAIQGIRVDTSGEYGWFEGSLRRLGDKGAQAARAVLSFTKDATLGLGQLAYESGKLLVPGGSFHATLDAQILAEHIRLGNICLESLKQAAQDVGQAIVKPVTDAWERGDYLEAVTRGGLEIGTLIAGVGAAAKTGAGGKAASAAAASADDVVRAAGGRAASGADDVVRVASSAADDAGSAAVKSNAPAGSNGVKVESSYPLRQAYIDEVNALKAKADEMLKNGVDKETIAREMHASRRGLGVKYKNLTPEDMLEKIYQRNIEKYGDKLGPSIEWLRARGKSWDDIIESATRTGGKDLGL